MRCFFKNCVQIRYNEYTGLGAGDIFLPTNQPADQNQPTSPIEGRTRMEPASATSSLGQS